MKCKVCGKNCEKEYCWRCKPKTALRKSKIRKEETEVNEMWDFFLDIWKKRKHYSEISGIWLGKEPRSYMFEHLLEKETYPEIAFEDWNIALVTLEEHDAKTMGFPLPKHKELIDKAYELYTQRVHSEK